MHTRIDTVELKRVLEVATRVTTKHLTLPVLACVLIEADARGVVLKATNLEIGFEGSIPASVEAEGSVAVPAQVLLQTIGLVPDAQVELKTDGEVLTVASKTSRSTIKTVDTSDFPHIPKIHEGAQKIKAATFALGIKSVSFAASQSSIKPELGSIYVYQKKEHSLTFVATDSFRLMEKTVSQQGLVFQDAMLVPYKNALELARVAELGEGDIDLFATENQCAIQVGVFYITSRLTTGTFPDYEQIIPKEYTAHATLLANDFTHGLKKTNIFLNKFMQLTVSVGNGTITLASQSGDVGATSESIVAATEGDELTLNFNQRYLSEVMQHVVDDSIALHFAGIGRPVVCENVHDRSMRYLVMPMNK